MPDGTPTPTADVGPRILAALTGPTAAAGLILLALLTGCAPENGAPGGGEGDDLATTSGAGASAGEAAARPRATEPGSFEVTFSGRREGTLSGEARFYHMNLGFAQPIPRIVLYDVRGSEDYFYVHLQPSFGSTPDEGTYPASAFQQDGFMTAAMEMQGTDLWLLAAESEGTVTLTEVSDGRMAGSFVLREPREGGATLEGTFEAPLSSMDEIPEPVR